jgi:hypothetical protein
LHGLAPVLSERQRNPGTAGPALCKPDVAAMSDPDLPGQRKANAGTTLPGLVKGYEDLPGDYVRNAGVVF